MSNDEKHFHTPPSPPAGSPPIDQLTSETKQKVPVSGYFALAFAVVFFSGVFADAENWTRALDFGVISGGFGVIADGRVFTGAGGTGARHGFMFALTLLPIVMFALGTVQVVDALGGLKAAQKFLTPVLRPLIGIPGICGLALITSLQSTDGGAVMNRTLREEGHISENEKTVFGAFQFSAGGALTNYLSSGAALFAFLVVPIATPLLVIFVMKIIGANIMRLYLKKFDKKQEAANG
ncbi:MAG: hypothetical protein FWG66_14005 [Spirochaetes bacterium]|nr:hypothetical protein [Spirochaetota bacterium]